MDGGNPGRLCAAERELDTRINLAAFPECDSCVDAPGDASGS